MLIMCFGKRAFARFKMTIKTGWSFLLWSVLFMPAVILGQTVSGAGTSAATFLKVGIGARALGMGEAYATVAEDVTATYWNPSGLADVKTFQVLLNHYQYMADVYFDCIATAIPLSGVGTVGVSFTYMGMPDIERTTIERPEGTGEKVSASSFDFGLSYARNLTDRFSIGGTVKYIQESLWHTSANGMAMDVGVNFRTAFKNTKIGMSISNFGSSMQLSGRDLLVQHDIAPTSDGNNSNINADLGTDKYSLPLLFRVGISANIARDFLGMENNDFIIAVNAYHPNDNYEYMNVGAEYSFHNLISLRGGYRELFLQDREGGLTLGMGLHLDVGGVGFQMDYAAADYGRLDYLNKFSIILAF